MQLGPCGVDRYAKLCVREMASGEPLCWPTELNLVLCGSQRCGTEQGAEGAQEGRDVCVPAADAHSVWQKPTQGCETIIL